LLLLGCPTGDDDDSVYDPGATQTCVCGSGPEGVQICEADGGRWGECDCGSGDDDDTTNGGTDDDGDGYSECDGDCEDADASINPGADDRCDGQDEDGDGLIDEGHKTDWILISLAGQDVHEIDPDTGVVTSIGPFVPNLYPDNDLALFPLCPP